MPSSEGKGVPLFHNCQSLGMDEKRAGLQECQLCDNSDFRPGVVCQAPGSGGAQPTAALNPQAEEIVKKITDQILAAV